MTTTQQRLASLVKTKGYTCVDTVSTAECATCDLRYTVCSIPALNDEFAASDSRRYKLALSMIDSNMLMDLLL